MSYQKIKWNFFFSSVNHLRISSWRMIWLSGIIRDPDIFYMIFIFNTKLPSPALAIMSIAQLLGRELEQGNACLFPLRAQVGKQHIASLIPLTKLSQMAIPSCQMHSWVLLGLRNMVLSLCQLELSLWKNGRADMERESRYGMATVSATSNWHNTPWPLAPYLLLFLRNCSLSSVKDLIQSLTLFASLQNFFKWTFLEFFTLS